MLTPLYGGRDTRNVYYDLLRSIRLRLVVRGAETLHSGRSSFPGEDIKKRYETATAVHITKVANLGSAVTLAGVGFVQRSSETETGHVVNIHILH